MVRLEEVEDEAFVEKPESSKDDALLVDDDADYTDTGEHTVLPSPRTHSGTSQQKLSCARSPCHLQHLHARTLLHPRHFLTIHRLRNLRSFRSRRRRIPRRIHLRTYLRPPRHDRAPDPRQNRKHYLDRHLCNIERCTIRWKGFMGYLHKCIAVGTSICACIPG